MCHLEPGKNGRKGTGEYHGRHGAGICAQGGGMCFNYTVPGLIPLVQKLREAASELEKATRVMMATLMNIHSIPMHQGMLVILP
jgi:hypothetical protein